MVADAGAGGVATLSTGGIFQLSAPERTPSPYTIFREASDFPEYNFGNAIAADHMFYFIQAWAKDPPPGTPLASGPSAVAAIADRLRVLFTNPSMTVSGKTVLSCRVDRSYPPQKEYDTTNQAWWYTRGVLIEAWLV